jgi:hypothetical protein
MEMEELSAEELRALEIAAKANSFGAMTVAGLCLHNPEKLDEPRRNLLSCKAGSGPTTLPRSGL